MASGNDSLGNSTTEPMAIPGQLTISQQATRSRKTPLPNGTRAKGEKIDDLEEKSSQTDDPWDFWENKQARHPPAIGTKGRSP
ncbi:hypothetical protein RRG08_025615 [Elysia crispata]|uniref:Uncharacterized protein n=1 Tax=Elysia crispata TaxID=231223 RepID=A0AAE0YF80_9GAST|nr:hypothetical protein RRG08_025615 [Elysia crispata]